MRQALRLTVIAALALGGVPAAPAQDVPELQSEATTLSLTHDSVTCMVADQFPQVDASLVPELAVQTARVYFHSALGADFYYVEMMSQGGLFVGTLPKPSLNAGPVTYYVEGMGTDYSQTQTRETLSTVVEAEGDCRGKVAPYAPAGSSVQVFSVSGSTAVPPGFSGVSSVLASTGGAAAGAGATGGFLGGTAGLIIVGAGAIGVATVIVVTGGEDPPPVSGSQ